MNNINKIFILGGTHGNEFTGAYIVNNWDEIAHANSIDSHIEVEPVLTNPLAFEQKTRYVDDDLNRSFSLDSLNDINTSGYEQKRAKEVNSLIGPKKKTRNNSTFLIDMHTTNANMGITLMTSKNDVNKLNLIKYICDRVKDVNVIFTDDEDSDRPFLGSVTEHSLLVEIGGVHNNTLNHAAYESTVSVLKLTIEFLWKLKNGSLQIEKGISIPAFSIIKKVPFPRKGDGSLNGVIHKEIQNCDFKKQINKDSKIFMLFDGSIRKLDEDGDFYMSFINESAYYSKTEDVAFYLMKKIKLTPR